MITPDEAKSIDNDFVQKQIAEIDKKLALGQRSFKADELGFFELRQKLIPLYREHGWIVQWDSFGSYNFIEP